MSDTVTLHRTDAEYILDILVNGPPNQDQTATAIEALVEALKGATP